MASTEVVPANGAGALAPPGDDPKVRRAPRLRKQTPTKGEEPHTADAWAATGIARRTARHPILTPTRTLLRRSAAWRAPLRSGRFVRGTHLARKRGVGLRQQLRDPARQGGEAARASATLLRRHL